MAKSELKKAFTFTNDYNEEKRNLYLREMCESVCRYIKTGVKNKQLEELIPIEDEFRKKYEKRFDTSKIVENIRNLEYNKSFNDFIAVIEDENGRKNEVLVQKFYGQIMEDVLTTIQQELEEIIRDTAYLSHMNVLYELYTREEKLKYEEEKFQKLSEKYQLMADIAELLSKQRRMELEDLRRSENVSYEDMRRLLSDCSEYFNIRTRNEKTEISLSPTGRKYIEYILNKEKTYSYEALNQLVYENCDSLMDALENSCEKGIKFELKLKEISADRERAIKHKYFRTWQAIMADKEEGYSINNIVLELEERAEDEESSYRISDVWYKNIY